MEKSGITMEKSGFRAFWLSDENDESAEKGWKVAHLIQHQGFWIPPRQVPWVTTCRQHFQARKDDLIITTTLKSGTTWLKALAFTVLNRTNHDLHHHPLLTANPHDLVPNIEMELYTNCKIPDLAHIPSPRLFSSHLPYQLLPPSIIESDCRIVHLCRNPKDNFVSMWHSLQKLLPEGVEPVRLKEAFELFCRGISVTGPFWDHVLGYWKASLEKPERVLFMKYEELREDPTTHLRRLAEFLGCPFSEEEERDGLVEEISSFCSFGNLSSLDVNKTGKTKFGHPWKNYFRRGVVGDWANYLTAEMGKQLDDLTQQKLASSGLTFNE